MRVEALALVLLSSCGFARTPYVDLVRQAPSASADSMLAAAESNPVGAESMWRNRLVRFFGRIDRIEVRDKHIGRSSGLSACADVRCANKTRREHVARIATAYIAATGTQAGFIVCEFSEQRFKEAAVLNANAETSLGGEVVKVDVVDGMPLIKAEGCVSLDQ